MSAMSGESGIEWCDRSWEVVAGCTKVSSGCANCYAERLVGTRHAGVARKRKRDGVDNGSAIDLSLEVINDKGRWSGDVRLLEMNLGQPLSRKAPTVYFVNSRSDLFHEDVPFSYVDKVFAVMALCPRHRFLVLTKRPERMRAYLDWKGLGLDVRIQDAAWYSFAQKLECSMPLPNVWLGASVEDQETANTRLPELLACPAAGRFISAEPLLGPVELPLRISQIQRHAQLGYSDASRVQSSLWVIVGGESGPGARVCNVAWIRSVVEQCRGRLAGVPVFVKQLGADVRDRNDAGFEGEPEDAWDLAVIRDVEHDPDGDSTQYQGKPVRVRLNSSKGNDPAEWPAGLRVRDVPAGLVIGEVSA